VGLGADKSTADRLLKLSGYAFGANDEHNIYAFLFEKHCGLSIDDFNDFIKSKGISPLGD
jgi:hypothetical protein